MADGKPRKARRAALGTLAVALVWLFGVWPPPWWWRDHWPRETAMMRAHGAASPVRPTTLQGLSPLLQRMVIIGEDSRFRTHHGVDPAEIADALGVNGGEGEGEGEGEGVWSTLAAAWRHRDRLRGASTITQQLAKNLYLSESRSPFRKFKEAITALRLELALSKDRILELYLNVVEWGPGVWGAEAASHAYFGTSAAHLDAQQAAALAATLPHPRTSNPTFRPERMAARRNLILARYRGVDVYIPPEEEADSLLVIPAVVVPESLGIEVPTTVDTLVDSLRDSLTPGRTDAPARVADSSRDSLP